MKKFILIFFLLLYIALPSSAGMVIGSGPSGGINKFYLDDFNSYADGQLETVTSGIWLKNVGDSHIAGHTVNGYITNGTSGGDDEYYYYAATDTEDQYAKWTLTPNGDTNSFIGPLFRFKNSTSPYYIVFFNYSSTIEVHYETAVGGTDITLKSWTTVSIADGDSFGVTVTGTGINTWFRIWKNPVAPDGTNITPTVWGVDDTPDLSYQLTQAQVDAGYNIDVVGHVYTGYHLYAYGPGGTKMDDSYFGDLD